MANQKVLNDIYRHNDEINKENEIIAKYGTGLACIGTFAIISLIGIDYSSFGAVASRIIPIAVFSVPGVVNLRASLKRRKKLKEEKTALVREMTAPLSEPAKVNNETKDYRFSRKIAPINRMYENEKKKHTRGLR